MAAKKSGSRKTSRKQKSKASKAIAVLLFIVFLFIIIAEGLGYDPVGFVKRKLGLVFSSGVSGFRPGRFFSRVSAAGSTVCFFLIIISSVWQSF